MFRIEGSAQQTLAAITLIIAGGAPVLSLVLTLLGGHRKGATIPLAVAAAFVLVPFHSPLLLLAIIPFALGFASGKTTRVTVDPADPFNTIELTPQQYHLHQMRLLELKRSRQFGRLMDRPETHMFQKLQLMMEIQGASLYRASPIWTVGLSIFYVWTWAIANGSGDELSAGAKGIVLLAALPYGTLMGRLYTYIRGHSLPLPRADYVFSPTMRSFLITTAQAAAATGVVAIVLLFLPARLFAPSMNRIALIVVAAIFLWRLAQTIYVHRGKLIVSPEGFLMWRAGRAYGALWPDVKKATIRERRNWLFRTDRIVILDRRDGHQNVYVTSILSPQAERTVLGIVRRHVTQTETVLDKGFY